jgi:hypothetical protein
VSRLIFAISPVGPSLNAQKRGPSPTSGYVQVAEKTLQAVCEDEQIQDDRTCR